MHKVALLLPAGNIECLRAAVANGTDAVYLGLNAYSARASAVNFSPDNLKSAVDFCHTHSVKAYIALNTLIKNSEVKQFFHLVGVASASGADAVIIQDSCFIPLIKKNFPQMKIHLSTQATTTNRFSVPNGADRIILARELSYDEISEISRKVETEIFVHGALCFSYSGQCLLSSMATGKSGNRGRCLQLCRKKYNNNYCLSTMDLCLLEKIPELIKIGVACFKVEGRLRSPLYVATVARIYRKYIDLAYSSKFSVEENDINELKMAFNREFTPGFAFTDNIIDSTKPGHRGLYIGNVKNKLITLKKELKVRDGIGIWLKDEVVGQRVKKILKDGISIQEGHPGDTVQLDIKHDNAPIYKTSTDMPIHLGDELVLKRQIMKVKEIDFPHFTHKENTDIPRLFIKAYSKKAALQADPFVDVIYYDVLKDDCQDIKLELKHAKLFVITPRIISDAQIQEIVERIKKIKPDGVLVGNRGFLQFLQGYELHLDYSFNCFNDIDINCYPGIPIISPELTFSEVCSLSCKKIILIAPGDIVVMTAKQKIKAPELIDEEGRHFKVREYNKVYEVLNCKQIGLFNNIKEYIKQGIKYFYLDISDAKYAKIYRQILEGSFDDSKIRKGFTKGHFERGVA
jgi:collagenase-like PrtC family protease